MHGNVWEWVEDCWRSSYAVKISLGLIDRLLGRKGLIIEAPTDGSAWYDGACHWRLMRGGSWFNGPWFLRSAFRFRYLTGGRYYYLGFRVARTLTP